MSAFNHLETGGGHLVHLVGTSGPSLTCSNVYGVMIWCTCREYVKVGIPPTINLPC